MAVQPPTFDQASVAITRWYFNMRVDYLSEEELNQELLARSILLTDDFGVARKRKWVRDRLKAEKDGKEARDMMKVVSDEGIEIQRCMDKFNEIRVVLQ